MFIELAALKYIFSNPSSSSVETQITYKEIPEVSDRAVVTALIVIVMILGVLFSVLSAKQNFFESLGWIISGIEYMTVGCVTKIASVFDNLTTLGKILLPGLLITAWFILLSITLTVSIYVAVPIHSLLHRLSQKMQQIIVGVVLVLSIACMVKGYQDFTATEKEKEEETLLLERKEIIGNQGWY